jgi:hypothetical protein
MKIWKFILPALLLALGVTACNEPEELAPKINVGESEVVISNEGTSVSLGYMVENAPANAKVEVENSADWLTVKNSKVRTLEFSATLNESGGERSVEVTLTYPGAESVVVKVTQQHVANPLTINIEEVNATEVVFSVTTEDPELTWIPMVCPKDYYDFYGSESAIFKADMEYFQFMAQGRDETLEEFLTWVLQTGDVSGIFFEGLDPQTEYVLYAYGITKDGTRTTEFVVEHFTTTEAWDGDITVEFSVSEEDHVISFDAIPSYTGVPYFCHYTTERELEQWKEMYGTTDLKTLIQKGSINSLLAGLMDVGFMSGPEDFYLFFNSTGKIRGNYFPCKASTKYIFFAAKWNEQCELVGEVSTYEYTSQPVEPSNNVITLSVGEITQSSAEVIATTTNSDTYTIMPVKTSDLVGKSKEEIFDFIDRNYYLDEFVFSGDKNRVFSSLEPSTDYTFVAFGYKAKSMTTEDFSTVTFRTSTSTTPEECVFEFEYELYDESVWVKVEPSDSGHYYYWGVFDARFTEQDVKDYINLMIQSSYEGNAAAFASWWLKQGIQAEEVVGLYASTEYRVAAVIMDYNTGEFLAPVAFSEIFRTPDPVFANVEITLYHDSYFDIDELAANGYSQFRDGLMDDSRFEDGGAILPISISTKGDCKAYYYYVVRRDLSDPEMYPDEVFHNDIFETGSTFDISFFPVTYNTAWTIAAMAIDSNDNYTPVYREVIYLTPDGVAPVAQFSERYGDLLSAPSMRKSVEWPSYDFLSAFGAQNDRPLVLLEGPAEEATVPTSAQKREGQLREAMAAHSAEVVEAPDVTDRILFSK